jgi:hypothetical protein
VTGRWVKDGAELPIRQRECSFKSTVKTENSSEFGLIERIFRFIGEEMFAEGLT